MAVVAPAPPPRIERPGTGLLLAGFILGLLGVLGALGVLAWLLWVLMAAGVPIELLFYALFLWGFLGWFAVAGFILGLIGTIMVYMAWVRAKRGEPAGGLGIVGGILLLISGNIIAGILAIIGGAQAK